MKDYMQTKNATTLLDNYGQEGIYFGVPVKLGASGVEEILELELDESQYETLRKSSETIRNVISQLEIWENKRIDKLKFKNKQIRVKRKFI